MKIGVFTALFNDVELEPTLDYLQKVGFEAVELYCGPLFPSKHCDPDLLLASSNEQQKLLHMLAHHNMQLSMLNCSGNPISPNKALAKSHHETFEKTVLLAEKLGVHGVIVFSGCPGGGPNDETPNWVTCPWPDEYTNALDYQWNEVLIPYWQKASQFAADHGVMQIAFEMHPGFCVYNPESLLRLRKAVGPSIGANFDPSHLFWQGIDAAKAILALGDAVFHVHAKDTRIFSRNVEINGVLDTKHYGEIKDRAWVFSTVGYGHGGEVWRGIVDALGIIGYDYVISIEHEDSLKGKNEGLEKAYEFLQSIVVKERAGTMWWA